MTSSTPSRPPEIPKPARVLERLCCPPYSTGFRELTEWVFSNPLRPEQPADPGSAYRWLKASLKQAGLPSIRFHDLRHPNVKPKVIIWQNCILRFQISNPLSAITKFITIFHIYPLILVLYTNRSFLRIVTIVNTALAAKDRLIQNGCLDQYCKVPDIIAWLLAVYPYFHITSPALIEDANS